MTDHPRTWDLFAVRRWVGGKWRYYAPFEQSGDWMRITHRDRGEVVPVTLTEDSSGVFYGLVPPVGTLVMVEFGRRRFDQQFPSDPQAYAAEWGAEIIRLAVSER